MKRLPPSFFTPLYASSAEWQEWDNVYAQERGGLRKLGWSADEQVLSGLMDIAQLVPDIEKQVQDRALQLVEEARKMPHAAWDVGSFMRRYRLGQPEGLALLGLAEALLRTPDAAASDGLIAEALVAGDWRSGGADSWIMEVAGRGLQIASALVANRRRGMRSQLVRAFMLLSIRQMAKQFVVGRTIQEALSIANRDKEGWWWSFDMLGEAACTHDDAERYTLSYKQAILAVGQAGRGRDLGVSVKLSALNPRYDEARRHICGPELIASLLDLAQTAKMSGTSLTVDAEEAERLELSLDIFETVRSHSSLAGWDGLGLAVQAYDKRALAVVDLIADMARRTSCRISVRLVKGAYWDSEIKHAQAEGHKDYPVFTRKVATDVSWVACARRMLTHGDALIPVFATHNARSMATVLELGIGDGEMQRLYGMGGELYHGVRRSGVPVRLYAPVGTHKNLLPYLVRRLLENGANGGFVSELFDSSVSLESLIADPITKLKSLSSMRSSSLALPPNLFADRKNSLGLPIEDRSVSTQEVQRIEVISEVAKVSDPKARWITSPTNRQIVLGHVVDATPEEIHQSLSRLSQGWKAWNAQGADVRAQVLERAADLFEEHRSDLLRLIVQEAGRTIPDAIGEWREAVDFLRYYALSTRRDFVPRILPGITGEQNEWKLEGRGVFACISPWNFPLSLFIGQVAAALAAGNAVAAKPAEQTPLVALKAVSLLRSAGVPDDVLAVLIGDGETVGAMLVVDPRIAGIAFTGGTKTARTIAYKLALRDGPLIPFIAETGGINAMLVDSTALPEQVAVDVVRSAFGSAGQRCSALRLLCIQQEVFEPIIRLIMGFGDTLCIGDPLDPATDIGPVIDESSRMALKHYSESLGKPLWMAQLPEEIRQGTFFAPRIHRVDSVLALQDEVFGPILHVMSYASKDINKILEDIASLGYGLTLGVHSRRTAFQNSVIQAIPVGNVYVNRTQIGAVVGCQPFGGHGLSGTGPKAGGPLALYAYARECVVCINTSAVGGNASLMAGVEDN
jgi:RHH-type transcriptional regulator, proline utilization regulon repressor / proline dehydrogenase / delta 1-pyrroline-5-carboxylate dehydrogenase